MLSKSSAYPSRFYTPEVQIVEIGYAHLNNTWNYTGSRSPYACLYLVEDGEGTVVCNGKSVTLQPNHAYLLPTNLPFDYSCAHSLTKLYLHINIIGSDGMDILQNIPDICVCELEPALLQQLIDLRQQASAYDVLAFRQQLYGLLLRLLSSYPADLLQSKHYSNLVQNIMRYVQDNLSYSLSTKQIAEHFFLAPVTLRKHFCDETGITLRQYIENLVFFNAELMLRTTDTSIKEISATLGFQSPFYFSKRFYSRYHLWPSAYRTTFRNTP